MTNPRISLLLMTYNRRGAVARCFRSLAETMERPDVETLILDNASVDGCAFYVQSMGNWLARFAAVHYWLSASNRGVAGGRNFLMERAKGDIFVLLDSDIVVTDDGWLEQLIRPLDNGVIGITGPAGHFVTVNKAGEWQWFKAVPKDYEGEVDVVSGYCQAFRREVWDDGHKLDTFFNPYWLEDSFWALSIKDIYKQKVWCDNTLPIQHIYAGSGDDGRKNEKFAYFAKAFKGKKLIRAEKED